MLIIFILIAIIVIITILVKLNDEEATGAVLGCAALLMIGLGIVWGASYSSYLTMRSSYDTVVTQYKDSVTMYEDMAVLDVKDAALTDFKYKGYQDNIASFVRDLRRQVVEYNEFLIEKRTMKKNLFLNWLIVAPDDDMKLINLKD